jgi:hypothetical protein
MLDLTSKFRSKFSPVSVTDASGTALANIYIGISLYKSVLVGTVYRYDAHRTWLGDPVGGCCDSWFSVMRSKIKNRTSSCNKPRLALLHDEATK